jgi:hypothetical protein
MSIFQSVCLSIFQSVYISVCLSFSLSVFISVCLSVYISVSLSVSLSICLYISLSVCITVSLSVCLFVCMFDLHTNVRGGLFANVNNCLRFLVCFCQHICLPMHVPKCVNFLCFSFCQPAHARAYVCPFSLSVFLSAHPSPVFCCFQKFCL